MKNSKQKSLKELMQAPLPRSTDWMDRVAEDQLFRQERDRAFFAALLLIGYKREKKIGTETLARRLKLPYDQMQLILRANGELSPHVVAQISKVTGLKV